MGRAFTARFTTVSIVGICAGTYLVRSIPQAQLERGVAVSLLVMGGIILWQNRGAVPPAHGTGPAPAAVAGR